MLKLRGFHLLIAVVLGLAVPVLCGAQRPLGPRFQVNIEAAGLQFPASLAMNARGEFVVAWVNVPVDGVEPRTIVARKFAADGMPATDEIQVAEFSADVHPAEVVIREDGSFFVVLPVYPDLVARRYGPDGAFVGESVVARGLLRRSYAVGARPDGGFVLVWTREPRGLVVQVVGASGERVGPERRLGQGEHPAVAAGPDGDFVAAWVGEQATGDPWEGGSPSRGGSTASSAVFPSRGMTRATSSPSGGRRVSSGWREPGRGPSRGSTAGASTRTAPR